jgi:hypothetical protein
MSGKQNYSRITQAPGCCEERIAISTRGKAIKPRRAAPEHLTSARPMDIDLSSVERILTAIDEDCIPTGLDKEGLLSGLRSCRVWRLISPRWRGVRIVPFESGFGNWSELPLRQAGFVCSCTPRRYPTWRKLLAATSNTYGRNSILFFMA